MMTASRSSKYLLRFLLAAAMPQLGAAATAEWHELVRVPVAHSLTRIQSLAIDADSRRIYATLGIFTLFVSDDGGETWSRPDIAGVPREHLSHLAADPVVPGRVYATGEDGIYRSDDGGESWRRVWTGETTYLDGYDVTRSLVGTPMVHPFDSTLYTSRRFYCSSSGCVGGNIFRSTDAGGTWQPLGLPQHQARHLAIARDRPGLLYAGVHGHDVPWPGEREAGLYRSTDHGATWEKVFDDTWLVALAIDPVDGNMLYAAATYRFWTPMGKSIDGGKSWIPLFPTGIRNDDFHVNVLVVDPSKPHTVYAGTTIGVLRSINGGRTWSEYSDGIPERCSVWTLGAARGSSMLYAGLDCNPYPGTPYHAIFGIDRYAGVRRRPIRR